MFMLRAMSVWSASGLVLSGFAMAIFGQVAPLVVLQMAPSGRWPAYVGLWLILLLVPAFVVNRIGVRHHPAILAKVERATREATRVVLADQVRDEVRKGRQLSWTTVLIAALLAALAWWGTVQRFRGGMPDLFDTAYTAGVTLLLAGVLLFAVLLGRRGWPRMRDGGPFGALGAAVGALALLLVFGSVTVLPVDATTIQARDSLAGIPESVSGVGWTWEAPRGEYVREAVAAGPGVMVRIGDGVVAVDGRTGEQLWHYRRPGAETGQLFTAVDGSTVMVTFQDVHAGSDHAARLVALDAHTGRVRAEDVRRSGAHNEVRRMDLFHDGYVTYDDEEGAVVGLDPESFAQMWRFQSPEACVIPGTDSRAGAADVATVAYECAGPDGEGSELVLVGLDPAYGSQVWRYETTTNRSLTEIDDYGYGVEVRTGVDGVAVALAWRTLDDDRETAVLDQADGTVITDGLAGESLWHERGFRKDLLQPNSPFRADGYVTSSPTSESPVEFTWNPFDGGQPQRTAPVEIGEGSSFLLPGAALTDLLVTTEPVSLTEEPSGELTAHVAVHGVPWDGGEPWELGVEFEVSEHAVSLGWPDSTPLLRVPGALVIVQQGLTGVVGLV